jgi:hypothetical protein
MEAYYEVPLIIIGFENMRWTAGKVCRGEMTNALNYNVATGIIDTHISRGRKERR